MIGVDAFNEKLAEIRERAAPFEGDDALKANEAAFGCLTSAAELVGQMGYRLTLAITDNGLALSIQDPSDETTDEGVPGLPYCEPPAREKQG